MVAVLGMSVRSPGRGVDSVDAIGQVPYQRWAVEDHVPLHDGDAVRWVEAAVRAEVRAWLGQMSGVRAGQGSGQGSGRRALGVGVR